MPPRFPMVGTFANEGSDEGEGVSGLNRLVAEMNFLLSVGILV